MSFAKSILGAALTGMALTSAANGEEAEEAEDPGLEFLEYLGSWQEQDEEWLIVWENEQGDQRRRKRKRNDDD